MKEFRIDLPYTDKKIYRQVVAFLNFALNLTNQEQSVLAKLIEYNIEYKSLEEHKRAKFILSTSIKKEMYTTLEMKSVAFTQVINRLKKKKFFGSVILSEEGIVNSLLIIEPSDRGLSMNINLHPSSKKAIGVPEEIEVTELQSTKLEDTFMSQDFDSPVNLTDEFIDASDAEIVDEGDDIILI